MNRFSISALSLVAVLALSCSVDDREGALSASYSGKCVDRISGKAVPTEYFGAALLFGDVSGDPGQPKSFYVKPDGSYNNTRMYPASYKVWANGPFCEVDTLYFDLAGHKDFDLSVMPNITLTLASSSVSGGMLTMTVSYKVNKPGVSEGDVAIVFGTVSNPGQEQASRDLSNRTVSCWKKTGKFAGTEGFETMTIRIGDNARYYARMGAKLSGTDYWNYTEEIVIDGQKII